MINESEIEKPKSATAVNKTLIAVSAPLLNLRVNLSDIRLEKIVPPEMIMEIIPAYESGTFISCCMIGQAEPSSESGNPKLINVK